MINYFMIQLSMKPGMKFLVTKVVKIVSNELKQLHPATQFNHQT